MVKKCVVCGKEGKYNPVTNRYSKYCGKKCQNRYEYLMKTSRESKAKVYKSTGKETATDRLNRELIKLKGIKEMENKYFVDRVVFE